MLSHVQKVQYRKIKGVQSYVQSESGYSDAVYHAYSCCRQPVLCASSWRAKNPQNCAGPFLVGDSAAGIAYIQHGPGTYGRESGGYRNKWRELTFCRTAALADGCGNSRNRHGHIVFSNDGEACFQNGCAF
ncbi:hypothetical protein D3C76_1324490 [compost metagenome]